MSYDNIYAIASRAMSIEKLRIDTVANNIANQHSVQGRDGSHYQPMQVQTIAKPFEAWLNTIDDSALPTAELVAQNLPPNKVWQPGHPSADKQGYVTYPGISTLDEMTTLIRASRAYEANIKLINTAHSLYLQSLTIGEER